MWGRKRDKSRLRTVSDLTSGWVAPFSATGFIPVELGGKGVMLQTDLGGINTHGKESNGDSPQKMCSMRRELRKKVKNTHQREGRGRETSRQDETWQVCESPGRKEGRSVGCWIWQQGALAILVGAVPLDSSIGQERSEAPDVRQWRNNLEEGSGGSGGKDTIFSKSVSICRERKMEGEELRKAFFFFFFGHVLSVLICC